MENGKKKPTIDERLEALTQSLELLSVNMHAMQEKQAEQDERERRGRAALLAGIAAYLQALQDGGDASAV